jgi:hypothetical protein
MVLAQLELLTVCGGGSADAMLDNQELSGMPLVILANKIDLEVRPSTPCVSWSLSASNERRPMTTTELAVGAAHSLAAGRRVARWCRQWLPDLRADEVPDATVHGESYQHGGS